MKKTLLLAAAAVFAASNAMATWYVAGSDVDGQEWNTSSAPMKEVSTNVFEWSGKTLGSEFKIILDSSWGATDIGGGAGQLSLDVPYTYAQGEGVPNIVIANVSVVNNPKITLNMGNGTITVTGNAEEKEPVDPSDLTFYMIGSNVNGQSWALAQPDAAFTNLGNGLYRWEGEVLGSGFKINDGTWSNGNYNIGGNGGDIAMNRPFSYWADGNSGNIGFDGFTILNNPVVELNLNDETITLVGGQPEGVANWYVAGINGVYELTEDWMLSPVEGKDGIFSRIVNITESAGVFKISDNGWSHQYGTNDPEMNFIDPFNLEVYLDQVGGEGGDVPYELEPGYWSVVFDLNELMVTFESAAGVGVIGAEDGEAVYYNLQGARVANPDKGIYVKVLNGKAMKVVK